MIRILITDSVDPIMIQTFEEKGCDVLYRPNITSSEVHDCIGDIDVLIINSKIQVDKTLTDKASKLKIIGRLGSGREVVDEANAAHCGIVFHTSPEGNADAVAEHAMGLLLSLLHNIPRANAEVKNGLWIREPNRGTELMGKTIGIWGFGHTGKAFAKRIQSFSCNILAYDIDSNVFNGYSELQSTTDRLWEQADIISLHVPLTTSTQGMVNKKFITNCKKDIFLLNTSRGDVVDQNAVLAALKSGKIKGFASDVLQNEKLDSYTDIEKQNLEELNLYNTIITPHVAGWTHESKYKIAHILTEKVILSLKTQFNVKLLS